MQIAKDFHCLELPLDRVLKAFLEHVVVSLLDRAVMFSFDLISLNVYLSLGVIFSILLRLQISLSDFLLDILFDDCLLIIKFNRLCFFL